MQVTSPKKKKKRVTQVFKNIPNHSLRDLHTILNEHTSIISIQEPSKRKKNIFVYFLSVDFVNILPKSGASIAGLRCEFGGHLPISGKKALDPSRWFQVVDMHSK